MSDEAQEVRAGQSSVEVSQNAKGERAYKVKVYVDTTEEQLTTAREQAIKTLDDISRRF